MPFSVFSGYQKYGKIEKKKEKMFWLPISFKPILDNLQPMPAFISTGGAHQGQQMTIYFC